MGKRVCEHCGRAFSYRGTHARRFCSQTCYNAERADTATNDPSNIAFLCKDHHWAEHMEPRLLGRARAVRRFPLQPCEVCGTTEDIHRHHRDGDQSNMAAVRIGRPRGGVRPRIVALNRDRAMALAQQAAKHRDAGLGVTKIARAMGVHRETVRRWFAKYPV